MILKPLNEEEFYKAFAIDLARAQALVLIQSPYLRLRRLQKLRGTLAACIRRRVRICVFVRSPEDDPDFELDFAPDFAPDLQPPSVDEIMEAARVLLALGAHVTFRPSKHEKVAVVDENILWDGSLNVMSQNQSSERMTRFWSREMVYQAIEMHRLDCCETCLKRRLPLETEAESEKDLFKTIGSAIENRRKSLKLTQAELARKMGVSQSVMSNIESGKRNAGMKYFLLACCELRLHLRVSPWYLAPSLSDWDLDIAKAEKQELLNQERELAEQELERASAPRTKSLLLLNSPPTKHDRKTNTIHNL